MADRLSRIYGTEEDRVNCPFYAKIVGLPVSIIFARVSGSEHGVACVDNVHSPSTHALPPSLLPTLPQGACRHGDRCSRAHNKPLFSQTVCLKAMYVNPMASVVTSGGRLSREQEKQIQDTFEDFYIDVFEEVGKYGEVDDLLVCDNLSDHLIGNVYVKYNSEEDAAAALAALNGRW